MLGGNERTFFFGGGGQGVKDYETSLRAQVEAFEKERVAEKREFQAVAEGDRVRIWELRTSLADLQGEYDVLSARW